MNARRALLSAAALTAVVFACRPGPGERGRWFAARQAGAVVGSLEREELGARRDAAGPFLLTKYKMKLLRWADGRGVVAEELTCRAARRPGAPPYYIKGASAAAAFVYRRGASRWTFALTDAFGNVTRLGGVARPHLFTFYGVPLPFRTGAPPGAAADLTSLDVANGVLTRWRGQGRGGSWSGATPSATLWLGYDDEGTPIRAASTPALTLAPADAEPTATSFIHETPRLSFLPFAFRPREKDAPVSLAVTARLSDAATVSALNGPGQIFEGNATGNVVVGTFTVTPAALPPLEDAAPAAGRGATFARAGGGPWPLVTGGNELERLAAAYRAGGAAPVFVAGVALFAGNIVAPYEWLEVGGVEFAAPGRPRPQFRLALARRPRPVRVVAAAAGISAGPPPPGAGPFRENVPGLRDGDELSYRVYRDGAPTGYAALWYDAPAAAPAAFHYEGEILGAYVRGVRWAGFAREGVVRPAKIEPFPLGEIAALGSVVATTKPDAEPPYLFSLPLAGKPWPLTARWEGLRPYARGGGWVPCRVYRLEPGPVWAYFTSDGILARLDAGAVSVCLQALPREAKAAAAAQTGEPAPAVETGTAEPTPTETPAEGAPNE